MVLWNNNNVLQSAMLLIFTTKKQYAKIPISVKLVWDLFFGNKLFTLKPSYLRQKNPFGYWKIPNCIFLCVWVWELLLNFQSNSLNIWKNGCQVQSTFERNIQINILFFNIWIFVWIFFQTYFGVLGAFIFPY